MKITSLRPAPLALALLCAATGLALVACQPASNAPPAAQAAPAPAPTSGIDLAGMDQSVVAGDDFYAYANGHWQQTTDIPADRASTGVFYTVFERAEKRLSDLMQSLQKENPAAGSNERKIVDYYAAFMNESAIESAGLTPLKPSLDLPAAHLASTMRLVSLSESVRAFAPGPLHLVGDACGPIGALPPGSGEVDVAAVCRALPKDSTLTFLPWIGLTAKEAMAGLHAISRLHPAAQHAEQSWPSSPVPRPAE